MSMRQKAPLLSFILTVIAGLAFAAVDPSASGPHKTAELDFPELVDASRRQASEAQKGIRRIFGERRAEKSGAGRKVPVKVHLPVGDSKCPVIIVSHGAGGDLDTHFAQARHLATHGYVVLCVEHVGSNREKMTEGLQLMKNLEAMIHDSAEITARPQDITFVLNQAESWNQSHPRLKG